MTTQKINIVDTWQLVASEPCMIQFKTQECYMSIGNIPTDVSEAFYMHQHSIHISGGTENIYVRSISGIEPNAYVVVAK